MKIRVYLLGWMCNLYWGIFGLAAYSQTSQPISLLSVADSLMDYGNFSQASEYFVQAIPIAKVAEDWENYVRAYNGLGYCQARMNLSQEAEKTLNQGLEVALSKWGSQNPVTANCYEKLGFLYYWTDRAEEALENNMKALEVRLKLFGEKHKSVGESYWAIGNVYRFNLFQHGKALEYYNKGINILEETLPKDDPSIGKICYAIATTYRQQLDYEKALVYAQRALNVFIQNPQKHSRDIRIIYVSMANIYYNQDSFRNSIEFYQKALTLKHQFSIRDICDIYNNLGSAEIRINSLKEALKHANTAIQLNLGEGIIDLNILSDSYILKGHVFEKLGDFGLAEKAYEESLKVRKRLYGQNHQLMGEIYQKLGDLYISRDSIEHSLKFYQKALNANFAEFDENDFRENPPLDQRESKNQIFTIVFSKAIAFSKLYERSNRLEDLQSALDMYEYAEKLNDLVRNSDIQEESQLFLNNYFQKDFELAIQCSFKLYEITDQREYLNKAFRFIEKQKYMLLFRALALVENRSLIGIPDSVKQRESTLKREISEIRSQLQSGYLNDQNSVKNELQQDLFDLLRQKERLTAWIRTHNPNYYQIKYDSLSLNINNVQDEILDHQTVAIEFFEGDQQLYGLLIAKDSLIAFKVEGYDEIRQVIFDYLNILSFNQAGPLGNSFSDFQKISFQLYSRLIEPVFDVLPNWPQRIIIIPDGMLAYLPFETLIRSEPANPDEVNYQDLDYLIHHSDISYAYSANLLSQNIARDRKKGSTRFLAYGYSSGEKNFSSLGRNDQEAEIPGTAREIKAISGIIDNPFHFYLGEDATEHSFKTTSPDFNIIHLAVHGIGDSAQALNSKLLFKNSQDSLEDGSLYAHELYDLDLNNLNMVVLSGCETGIGKEYQGEGIFSMARGFAYAGCPSIVMSLWKVNDRATSGIMADFYQHLSQGLPIDRAMRMAKIDFINQNDEISSHPGNWSSFVVLGDYSPVLQKRSNLKWIIIGVIILMGILVFLFLKRRNQIPT